MKVALGIVVRRWQILGEENLNGQWFGQGGDKLFCWRFEIE